MINTGLLTTNNEQTAIRNEPLDLHENEGIVVSRNIFHVEWTPPRLKKQLEIFCGHVVPFQEDHLVPNPNRYQIAFVCLQRVLHKRGIHLSAKINFNRTNPQHGGRDIDNVNPGSRVRISWRTNRRMIISIGGNAIKCPPIQMLSE